MKHVQKGDHLYLYRVSTNKICPVVVEKVRDYSDSNFISIDVIGDNIEEHLYSLSHFSSVVPEIYGNYNADTCVYQSLAHYYKEDLISAAKYLLSDAIRFYSAQLRDVDDDNNPELDTIIDNIVYHNHNYPVIKFKYQGDDISCSLLSLQDLLFNKDDNYVDNEACDIDDNMSYYISDIDFDKYKYNLKMLRQYIINNIINV